MLGIRSPVFRAWSTWALGRHTQLAHPPAAVAPAKQRWQYDEPKALKHTDLVNFLVNKLQAKGKCNPSRLPKNVFSTLGASLKRGTLKQFLMDHPDVFTIHDAQGEPWTFTVHKQQLPQPGACGGSSPASGAASSSEDTQPLLQPSRPPYLLSPLPTCSSSSPASGAEVSSRNTKVPPPLPPMLPLPTDCSSSPPASEVAFSSESSRALQPSPQPQLTALSTTSPESSPSAAWLQPAPLSSPSTYVESSWGVWQWSQTDGWKMRR